MSHFQSFDSLEEMQAAMTAQHDAAMNAMDDRHRALMAKRKFYWARPIPELDCWVFGAYDLDAFLAREAELSDDPSELAYIRRNAEHNNMERGYKSGTAFSVICPEGEIGDTHVSVMLEITWQAFSEAKAVQWRLPGLLEECPTLKAEVMAFVQGGE